MTEQITVADFRKLLKKKPLQTEHQLQVLAFKWFRSCYPQYAAHFFAIPNGGARDKTGGAMLKAEGVLSGVWDTFLAVPRGAYSGMFIEFKVGSNKLSDNQMNFCNAISSEYRCAICYTIDEFTQAVDEYLKQKSVIATEQRKKR